MIILKKKHSFKIEWKIIKLKTSPFWATFTSKTLLKLHNNTECKNHQLIKIGLKTSSKNKAFLPMSISPFWATFMSTILLKLHNNTECKNLQLIKIVLKTSRKKQSLSSHAMSTLFTISIEISSSFVWNMTRKF